MFKENSNFKENIFCTKLKSQYILRKICNNLAQTKLLKYIRYNKEIQNKLEINIDNYTNEYLKSIIEIELNPIKDKCVKFINTNKKNQSHFHFYFDNNPKEIKNNYLTKADKVKKIKIIIDKEITSLTHLFEQRTCIKKINFLRFNRNNIKNMSNIFAGCSSLEEINLSHFNTDNVTNMSYMFYGCALLKEINLSKFDTTQVTNMRGMFSECINLERLDLSNFITNKVNDMCHMFRKCSKLKKLDVSNFNTNEVENMCEMFQRCSSLKELNLSNFKTGNLILMNFIFNDCTSLEKLNISNFDTKNMFFINCKLSQIYFPGFLTNDVDQIKFLLQKCSFYRGLFLSNFNINNIVGMANIFDGCASLKEVKYSDTLIKNEDVRNFRQYYLNLLNITNKDYTSLSEEDRESLMADESKKLMTLMIQKTDGTVTHYDFYRLYESSTGHISSGKVFVVVNGIGEFYTSNDLIDKIVNDTPRVLDGRDIDGYAQR